jgi:hypothetical protein
MSQTMDSSVPNGVVSHHHEDSKFAERGNSNGAQCVASKVQEGGTKWTEATVSKDAVTDRNHSVLPDAEADVSPSWGVSLEISGALQVGEVGWSQVGRATNGFWENGSNSIENNLGVRSSGDCFGLLFHRKAR